MSTYILDDVRLTDVVTVEALFDPGRRWNGYLCPLFTRSAVDYVMAALADVPANEADPSMPTHRWDGDVLIVTEYDDPDGPYDTRYEPVQAMPDDLPRYALGEVAWCWERAPQGWMQA